MVYRPYIPPMNFYHGQRELASGIAKQFIDLGVKTVLLGGSVRRGDTIPLSDLDLYLRTDKKDYKSFARSVIWPSLDKIHPVGLCGIQIRFEDEGLKSAEGTLEVLRGWKKTNFATDDELRQDARDWFKDFKQPRYYEEYLLHTGVDWAIRLPRLVMIDVFPALRNLIIVNGENPTKIWRIPKYALVDYLPEGLKDQFCDYFYQLCLLSPNYPNPNAGLRNALLGIDFLSNIAKEVH